MSVHKTAVEGFVQGDLYDKFRPSYSDEMIDYVVQLTGLDSDEKVTVLELGAGTGKFTQKIIPKLGKNVRYIATDQSPSFMETLKKNCPDVETEVCSADNIPLGDSSVEVIFGAQCYHWFANEESLKEMHRILVPGGRAVFLWNIKDRTVSWVKEIEDIVHEYYTEGIPSAISRSWESVSENCDLFHNKEDVYLSGHRMEGTPDDIVDHFATISVIARLGAEKKETVLERMRKIIDSADETKGKSKIMLSFRNEVYHFQKIKLD